MNRSSLETKIAILAAAFAIVVVGLLLISLAQHAGKVGVKVVLLPADSTLTIDGKGARAGTVYFTKTTHTLKASRQYFTAVTKTINFATYDKSQTIYMEPAPDSDQARQYLLTHPDVQAQREAAGGEQALQAQQQISKNKLTSLLPYTGPGGEYVVDYGASAQADGTQKITIYIEANTDQARQDALAWLTSQGAKPETLTIVYQPLSDTSTLPGSGNSGGSEYQ